MKQKLKYLPALFLAMCTFCSYSQQFAVKAELHQVSQTGFYGIQVNPDLSAYSKADLSDIRIMDKDGKNVPYLLRNDLYSRSNSPFVDFPILSKIEDTGRTVIELEARVNGFDRLLLEVANNSVGRFATLSGSNNRNNWYIVSEDLQLGGDQYNNSGSVLTPLSVPFSRYKYYRMVIRNSSNDPLNILRIGTHETNKALPDQSWVNSPAVSFKQKDTIGNRTIVSISQPFPYPVERMIVHASNPKYFARTIHVIKPGRVGDDQTIAYAELKSGIDSIIEMPRTKASSFDLVIDNGDNPSLQIDSIQLQQREKLLVVYLKQGESYSIYSGSLSLQAPDYDLQSFTDSIPAQLPLLQYSAFQQLTPGSKTNNSNNQIWIWAAIAGGLALLCWLTFSLLRDLGRKHT